MELVKRGTDLMWRHRRMIFATFWSLLTFASLLYFQPRSCQLQINAYCKPYDTFAPSQIKAAVLHHCAAFVIFHCSIVA